MGGGGQGDEMGECCMRWAELNCHPPEPWDTCWGGCPCASLQIQQRWLHPSRTCFHLVRVRAECSRRWRWCPRTASSWRVFCSLCGHLPGNPTGEPVTLLLCWLEKSHPSVGAGLPSEDTHPQIFI